MSLPRQRLLTAIATVALFGLALYALRRSLAETSLAEIEAQAAELRGLALGASALLTAASYACLTLYDALALRLIGVRLPYRRIALTSFVAYAFANTLGLSSLSGGSVRLRAYTAEGLSTLQIASVQALCTATFVLGATWVSGWAMVLDQRQAAAALHLSVPLARMVGLLLLSLVVAYALATALRRRPVRVRHWSIALPPLRATLAQLALSSLDLACAAACLYLLLPVASAPSFASFLAAYVLAIAAGVISNVPAGLGVFESTLVLLVPGVPVHTLLGAVLVYRVVYYLLPFALALSVLLVRELSPFRARLASTGRTVLRWLEVVTPQALASLVFGAGVVLLVSGSLPAIGSRVASLSRIVPLPIIELSHLTGSAIGVGLLILAGGLYRRLDAAYWLTQLLLACAIAASLLKGFDYEEALLLAAVMALLSRARPRFVRRAPLLVPRLSWEWLSYASLVLGAAIWLGLVAHQHVEYSHELWWQFAFDGDASRMLRASVLSVLLLASYALWQLLTPLQPEPRKASADELERASGVLPQADDTTACLALVGDKQLLFSVEQDAFIMYQRCGASWIALGDPVGPAVRRAELAWRFRELCDRYGGLCVFYQVGAEGLPLYLDLGLALTKLGEEARVDLPSFHLNGRDRAGLRAAPRKAEREGLRFQVVPVNEVRARMEQLRAVSDAWLAHKLAAEKGFSVGRFDPDYLARFPCALVTREDRVVAFANVLSAGEREELSIDLMRYGSDSPHGVMDYLLLSLMLWGQEQRYRWFNLGMAPLSGLEARPLAPLWHKVGLTVHQYGEPYYGFEGLRRYKQKFFPVWRPRYLASPGGLALPRVLVDTTTLIAGGLREVLSK